MAKKSTPIRNCQAWSKSTNAQCKNTAIRGTSYCWRHYPKKALIFELSIILPLTIVLTLLFNDPLIWLLSKVPVLHRLDKSAPFIESTWPDINKFPNVDKETKVFNVVFLEKDSGIDHNKSRIRISYKHGRKYVSLKGKVNKTNSRVSFIPENELQYGEYLLEVQLVDKADNKNKVMKSFVIREKDELCAFVNYDTYENASGSDRKIFNPFFESQSKEYLESVNFNIHKLAIWNKDSIAVLKNLYLEVHLPDMFFCWEEIGSLNTKSAHVYGSAAESFDKRAKGHIYINVNYLNIEEIGPGGHVIFLILAGQSKLLPESQESIWQGINIHGTYLSEGYGSSETRKVHLSIPKKDFKPLR